MPIVSTCEHLLVFRAAVELADQLALHWWSGPSPICMQLYIHNHILRSIIYNPLGTRARSVLYTQHGRA